MILDPDRISLRTKLIIAGLYLAKFDSEGLAILGFDGFVEAFNVIALALGGKPASIKNYRDEFDPIFPNARKGWHRRPLRTNCAEVLKDYGGLDLATFAALIQAFVGYGQDASIELSVDDGTTESLFARRLITGLAAEHYFESVVPTLSEFGNFSVENTTRLGCGYDFRLQSQKTDEYLAVEVKGLKDSSGSLSLTPKEHQVASSLTDRFYLFVVKNFRETPFHEIYRNPLASALTFARKERTVVQVSWFASV